MSAKWTAVARSAQMSAVPDGFDMDDHLGYLLRRAHQRSTAFFQRVFEDLQLTPTQFSALFRLSERGELSQNLLGRLTSMDPATIQGVIQRLEVRQLIERHPDPTDRRLALLSLTSAGRAMVRDANARVGATVDAAFAPLSAPERKTLQKLLRKIV